jgi:thiopurine S-methyltransferase
MLDFWHSRWEAGQTGWHEPEGNVALHKFWPSLACGSRVLVPLCGKSSDLLWLAEQGSSVTGIELSEIAARAFFNDAGLSFETEKINGFNWFRSREANIAIACGNYFEFLDTPFDALYDRAALVALPANKRAEYALHTKGLLKPDARQLLLTIEFDQSRVEGPPFSVMPAEVKSYWPDLERVYEQDDIENSPPRFRDAGIEDIVEVVWVSHPHDPTC